MIDRIYWYGHATMLLDGSKRIIIDPFQLAEDLPACDLVLITHPHYDHFSPDDIARVTGPDTTFVTVMRKFHRRKISQGGKDHLSHRLVALGMSERKAVFVLWSICALLAGLGVAASYLGLFASLVLMGAAIVAVVIFALSAMALSCVMCWYNAAA